MLKKSKIAIATLIVSSTFIATTSLAHDGAMGVVKDRMDIMEHVGKTMKMLSGMANGSVTFDAAKASEATAKISEDMDGLSALFEEGTGGEPSEAAPAIWTDRAEFDTLVAKLASVSAAASTTFGAASDNSGIGAVMGEMGATCKACHKKFRIKR